MSRSTLFLILFSPLHELLHDLPHLLAHDRKPPGTKQNLDFPTRLLPQIVNPQPALVLWSKLSAGMPCLQPAQHFSFFVGRQLADPHPPDYTDVVNYY